MVTECKMHRQNLLVLPTPHRSSFYECFWPFAGQIWPGQCSTMQWNWSHIAPGDLKSEKDPLGWFCLCWLSWFSGPECCCCPDFQLCREAAFLALGFVKETKNTKGPRKGKKLTKSEGIRREHHSSNSVFCFRNTQCWAEHTHKNKNKQTQTQKHTHTHKHRPKNTHTQTQTQKHTHTHTHHTHTPHTHTTHTNTHTEYLQVQGQSNRQRTHLRQLEENKRHLAMGTHTHTHRNTHTHTHTYTHTHSENSRRLWLFVGSLRGFPRGKSGKIAGKIFPNHKMLTILRFRALGKANLPRTLGRLLPRALPKILSAGRFWIEIDTYNFLEFFWGVFLNCNRQLQHSRVFLSDTHTETWESAKVLHKRVFALLTPRKTAARNG